MISEAVDTPLTYLQLNALGWPRSHIGPQPNAEIAPCTLKYLENGIKTPCYAPATSVPL